MSQVTRPTLRCDQRAACRAFKHTASLYRSQGPGDNAQTFTNRLPPTSQWSQPSASLRCQPA